MKPLACIVGSFPQNKVQKVSKCVFFLSESHCDCNLRVGTCQSNDAAPVGDASQARNGLPIGVQVYRFFSFISNFV